MATCILDYSPIDSLQKMVDTIPVNNVKSSGSEEKKKKKHKKTKERNYSTAIAATAFNSSAVTNDV